jgi:hypothetical protein
VRRTLDIPARWVGSGARVLLLLAVAFALGLVAGANLSGLVPGVFYDVAFMGATAGSAHSLLRSSELDRMAWNLGDGGRLVVLLAATLLEIALLLLVGGIVAHLTGNLLPATSLLGLLHLAAMALFLTRLPLRPATAVYVFFALIWVVPALIPALEPMLGVRRWFHPGGFPGWIGAVSPILALVLGAFALPARAASSSGTSSA